MTKDNAEILEGKVLAPLDPLPSLLQELPPLREVVSSFAPQTAELAVPHFVGESPRTDTAIASSETYPGPTTGNLDGLSASAQAAFRRADEEFWRRTKRQLAIESGLRNVYKQADLYIGWRLGQPGYNPADIPGVSVHNYGFAIDIRDSGNSEVVAALSASGWERTVLPSEPWHWEATAAAGYANAVEKRRLMAQSGSLARRWQDTWETARTRNDTRNAKIDEFERRERAWQAERSSLLALQQDLDARIARYNAESGQWNADRDAFNQRVQRVNDEVRALQALRARIESMPPSEERNRLIREYNQRAQALSQEQAAIESARASITARYEALQRQKQSLEADIGAFRQRAASFEGETAALNRLVEEIKRLEQEIKGLMATQKQLLDQLAREVQP